MIWFPFLGLGEPDRRIRMVEVSFELLAAMLRMDHVRPGVTYSHDFPDDAVIVDIRRSERLASAQLLIWSATFDLVPAGNIVPVWDPTYMAHTEAVA